MAFTETAEKIGELPDKKENSEQTIWTGIETVIIRRQQAGDNITFSKPKHPTKRNSDHPFRDLEIISDAFIGTYGSVHPRTALERYISAPPGLNTCAVITAWIYSKNEEQGHKVSHEQVFEYLLKVHHGAVELAVRDTMLYFQALARGRTGFLHYRKDDELQLQREKFMRDYIEPVDPQYPLPNGYDKFPDKNLNNRLGEYYHQYWLLYLNMIYRRGTVRILLATEYAFSTKWFGHGEIKKRLDFALVRQSNNMRDTLDSLPQRTVHKEEPAELVDIGHLNDHQLERALLLFPNSKNIIEK